jgi:hypothetical protein
MSQLKVIVTFIVLFYASLSSAEMLTPLALTPASPTFSTGATANPTYPAWTYETGAGDGHDIWTIDLTAFDANFLVSMDLTIGDYCCHADNYEVFWNSSSLGETGFGVQKLFQFDTTAAIHTLEIDWLNPISGGSWYNIGISATEGPGNVPAVPVPAAVWLFGTALLGLVGLGKRRKTA